MFNRGRITFFPRKSLRKIVRLLQLKFSTKTNERTQLEVDSQHSKFQPEGATVKDLVCSWVYLRVYSSCFNL